MTRRPTIWNSAAWISFLSWIDFEIQKGLKEGLTVSSKALSLRGFTLVLNKTQPLLQNRACAGVGGGRVRMLPWRVVLGDWATGVGISDAGGGFDSFWGFSECVALAAGHVSVSENQMAEDPASSQGELGAVRPRKWVWSLALLGFPGCPGKAASGYWKTFTVWELCVLLRNNFLVLLEHLLAIVLIILNLALEMGYVSLKRLFLTEFSFKGRFYRHYNNAILI